MDVLPAGAVRARPAICGALGRASVNFGAANQRSPNYADPFHQNVSESREHRSQKAEHRSERAKAAQDPVWWSNPKKAPPQAVISKATRIGAARTPEQGEDPRGERATKQERMLTLLSQPAGASIEEMMQATNWQQHSVRGFLAGTVKKKLGFALRSFKPDDGVRRYHIETRRGR
jgi:hypothetical protein